MDALTTNAPVALWLQAEHWEQMWAHASQQSPEEACGLLAGKGQQAEKVYPMDNALHSPVRFRLEATEQVRVFLEIERDGRELLAIYHSHPEGPPHPSPTDVAEAAYPDAVYLIWFRQRGQWDCRGYTIRNGEVAEVCVYVAP